MEELVSVLEEIRDQLVSLNEKVDKLTVYETTDLDDVKNGIIEAISSIMGSSGYDLTDIYNELSTLETELSSIDTSITMLG